MHVITLIEKQAIDHDMIHAEMNSLSPRPAACSPSNGGLEKVHVRWRSRRPNEGQIKVKPEKRRNACLSAISSFENSRLWIRNLYKCWQLTIIATFAIIVITSNSATSWMNFNTRVNIWTGWIELEWTWCLSYWFYKPKNGVLWLIKLMSRGSIWPIFGVFIRDLWVYLLGRLKSKHNSFSPRSGMESQSSSSGQSKPRFFMYG